MAYDPHAVFNANGLSLADGQQVPLQVDANGRLLVDAVLEIGNLNVPPPQVNVAAPIVNVGMTTSEGFLAVRDMTIDETAPFIERELRVVSHLLNEMLAYATGNTQRVDLVLMREEMTLPHVSVSRGGV